MERKRVPRVSFWSLDFVFPCWIPFLNQETANAEWPSDPSVNMPICDASGIQYGPKLIKVADGYIVVWQDQRRGSCGYNCVYTDIYA